MPQPVRSFTDAEGRAWLVLDNGHRIPLPSGGSGGGITEAEADDRYVNIDGDTMTGRLTIKPVGDIAAARFEGDVVMTNPAGIGSGQVIFTSTPAYQTDFAVFTETLNVDLTGYAYIEADDQVAIEAPDIALTGAEVSVFSDDFSVHGPLVIQSTVRPGLDIKGNSTATAPGQRPELRFHKMDGTEHNKGWVWYVAGASTETGPDASSMSLVALDDADSVASYPVFRFYRDGRFLLGADPTTALQAATKQYCDSPTATAALTPYTGWTEFGSGYSPNALTRQGGLVHCRLMFKWTNANTGLTAGSGYTVATIPAGLRPSVNAHMVGSGAYTTAEILFGFYFTADFSQIRYAPSASGTLTQNTSWISLSATWPI